MIEIVQYEPSFETRLPQTFLLLQLARLVIHPSVIRVTLHGSRGLGGNFRPDSDIDLSLLVPVFAPPPIDESLQKSLEEVLAPTLAHWRGPVKADLAIIFPLQPCRLACFQVIAYDPDLCAIGGTDCFGIFKMHQESPGFVRAAGVQVERMYPCITVWKRSAH